MRRLSKKADAFSAKGDPLRLRLGPDGTYDARSRKVFFPTPQRKQTCRRHVCSVGRSGCAARRETLRLIFLLPPAGGVPAGGRPHPYGSIAAYGCAQTLRGFFGTLCKAGCLATKFLPRFLKKAGGAWGRAPAGPGRGSGKAPEKSPHVGDGAQKEGQTGAAVQKQAQERVGPDTPSFGSTGSPLSPVATAVAAAARVPSSSTDERSGGAPG